jgi:hypothetical protein
VSSSGRFKKNSWLGRIGYIIQHDLSVCNLTTSPKQVIFFECPKNGG